MTRQSAAEKFRPSSKSDALDALLREINTTILDGWSGLTRDIAGPMPSVVAAGLMTGRAEMIRASKAEALPAEEVRTLLDTIATLIETNAALRQHAEEVAKLTTTWAGAFKSLATVGSQIEHFANFRPIAEPEEDQDV